jgi:hypothetical protein
MRDTGGGGYGGTIVVDIAGVRKASAVLADDASAFQVLAGRVGGHPLPEMPDGIGGRVTSALAEASAALALLPPTLIDQSQELRARALWAEIADQLASGHDLTGTQLAEFKASYASGDLTRYAEPWEADLAKAYAKKLEDSGHHGLLDKVESALGHAGDWAYNNIAVPTVNATASLGSAIVNDPGDTATTALGLVIMAGGDAIEGGGVALDATGVGAVAGVPLNALGAGVIATGAGVTAKGAIGLGNYAHEHPTQVLQESDGGKGVDRGDGRDVEGKFAPGNDGKIAHDAEKQGLEQYANDTGREVIDVKVAAKLPDMTPRYYDGLSPNGDGTYTAIETYTGVEVKSGTAGLSAHQQEFDAAVNSGRPATANLNGREIKITETRVIKVSR